MEDFPTKVTSEELMISQNSSKHLIDGFYTLQGVETSRFFPYCPSLKISRLKESRVRNISQSGTKRNNFTF